MDVQKKGVFSGDRVVFIAKKEHKIISAISFKDTRGRSTKCCSAGSRRATRFYAVRPGIHLLCIYHFSYLKYG